MQSSVGTACETESKQALARARFTHYKTTSPVHVGALKKLSRRLCCYLKGFGILTASVCRPFLKYI